MKNIAVLGCTVSFTTAYSGQSGTKIILSSPSTKVKAGSIFCYKGTITVMITGGSNGTISNATGTGTITPTATKTKAESQFVIRVDDESSEITMTGTKTSPPYTGTYTTKVYISDAGQSKVSGN